MITEERLVDIEIKLTRQEDLTQQLGQMVYEQGRQIAELRALCEAMARRMAESNDGGSEPYGHEKPPHY